MNTSKNIDIKEIAKHALATLYPNILYTWLPGGAVRGHEYQCGDLSGGKGESLSVNVNSGMWCDFAGNNEKGSDPVSLFAAIHKISQLQAAKELASLLGLSSDAYTARENTNQPAPPKPAAQPAFVQTIPAPEGFPDLKHRLGRPVRTWAYRTLTGDLIGYVCRFDKPEGGKEILPLAYGRKSPDAAPGWAWKSFNDPRPLYGLDRLTDKPGANVLIVEGEKAADAGAALLPSIAVLSWPGGGKAVQKADWTPLRGRKVIIMPDNDEPGFVAALKISEILRGLDCIVKFAAPPADSAEGWDIADADWTPEQAWEYLKSALADALPDHQPDVPPESHADDPGPDYYPSHDPHHAPAEPPRDFVLGNAPFRCLGYDKDGYYYFAKRKQQIVTLTAGAHTKNNLLQVADLMYWRAEFPKGKSEDFNIDSATDCMMRGCERAGIFNPDRIRGRGAWYDDGRVAVHLGNRVLIDGDSFAPAAVQSRFVYEAGDELAGDFSRPLSVKEANKFIELLDMLAWDKPMNAKLAAGWCVCAQVCGVLKWRPHIWIIGRKGSGKSYIMSNIIQPVLGRNSLFVQAGSTEAGIRQRLGVDSLPVLFDEAEGEDAAAHQNIQRVLALIRQSSSETGGQIAKGTPGGKSVKYMVRSCFALSSVNANLVQQSDRSRVTVMELDSANRRAPFEDIQRAEIDLLTDEYIARFYSRAIALAGVIRQNAVTFAKAAAIELGEQRAGDQTGTLLAGCYSLYSDRLISYDDAVAWVRKQDWSEQKEEVKGQNDENALWAHLMQQPIRVKLDSQMGVEDLPVGLLIDIATRHATHPHLLPGSAFDHLIRNGFKVVDMANDQGKAVQVSNTHDTIKRMLAKTQWPVNWKDILKRLPGAEKAGTVYFGHSGSEARAITVPLQNNGGVLI